MAHTSRLIHIALTLTFVTAQTLVGCGEEEPENPEEPQTLVGSDNDAGVTGRDKPIYVRVLFHFENTTNIAEAADDVLAQVEIVDRLGLPGEVDMHRGEHHARWYEQNRPDVLSAILASDLQLGYHPHMIEPFQSRVDELTDLSWDDAVAGQRDLAGCPIEFLSGEVDESCGRDTGGLARLRSIMGTEQFVGITSDGGINAVPTYVFSKDYGISVQTTGSYRTFPTPDTPFFWFMGTLVITGSAINKDDWWATYDQLEPELDAISGSEIGYITVLGSDKLRAPSLQDWAVEHYVEGDTDMFDLYPPECASQRDCPEGGDDPALADCWCVSDPPDLDDCMPGIGFASETCIAEYFTRFDQLLRDLQANPRVEFVGPRELFNRVHPAGASLSPDDLSDAATRLVRVYERTTPEGEPPRPPVEVQAGETFISLTNLYEALLRSLQRYRDNGSFPQNAIAQGEILGPPAEPQQCNSRSLPTVDIPASRLVNRLNLDSEFVPVEVSLTLDAGEQTLGAAEILYLLAKMYLELEENGGQMGAVAVARPPIRPCPRPTGAPGDDDEQLSAWEWHTAIQHWTTKRTDFQE